MPGSFTTATTRRPATSSVGFWSSLVHASPAVYSRNYYRSSHVSTVLVHHWRRSGRVRQRERFIRSEISLHGQSVTPTILIPPALRMRTWTILEAGPRSGISVFIMAGESDNSLYPIAVLIDELRNDDVQVRIVKKYTVHFHQPICVCVE